MCFFIYNLTVYIVYPILHQIAANTPGQRMAAVLRPTQTAKRAHFHDLAANSSIAAPALNHGRTQGRQVPELRTAPALPLQRAHCRQGGAAEGRRAELRRRQHVKATRPPAEGRPYQTGGATYQIGCVRGEEKGVCGGATYTEGGRRAGRRRPHVLSPRARRACGCLAEGRPSGLTHP